MGDVCSDCGSAEHDGCAWKRAIRPPKRRYAFTLDLHADTREGIAERLHEIAHDVLQASTLSSTGGGSEAGWHWLLTEDPNMTQERYFELLDQYREAMQNARGGAS